MDIRDNLIARIAEAGHQGWTGEAEGLKVSLAAANAKLAQLDGLIAGRTATVHPGHPRLPRHRRPHCRHPRRTSMTPPSLAAALRACAAGFYPLEAAVALLISHGTFLNRSDFRGRFIQHGTSISDGATHMADIDWDAAIIALDSGELPCSGGERRILQLAASLATGIPVDLRDAVTGLDQHNIQRLISAIRHASGKRSQPGIHDHL